MHHMSICASRLFLILFCEGSSFQALILGSSWITALFGGVGRLRLSNKGKALPFDPFGLL